jgi:sulfur-oxidizing protein SoxA
MKLAAAVLGGLGLVLATAQAAPRRSGYEDMGPDTQAMQRDDALNPASLWRQDGQARFAAACSACHSAATLRGVAARYPAWDDTLGRPVTLAARIALCQQRHLHATPAAPESDEALALQSYVASLSRGLPIAPPPDARLAPWRAQGQRLYTTRMGQLDFSCAQCHDDHAGGRLAGAPIPQGHPTAYPIYRLQWQGMGSLQRRLRGCMTGVRAEPWAYGSDEFTALELYLMQRAAGMAVESPGVRP